MRRQGLPLQSAFRRLLEQPPSSGRLRTTPDAPQPAGGLDENLLGLAEHEAHNRPAASVPKEARSRDRRDPDLAGKPDGERGVIEAGGGGVRRGHSREVRQDVIGALG